MDDYFTTLRPSLRYAGISLSENEGVGYKIYTTLIYAQRVVWGILLSTEVFKKLDKVYTVSTTAIFVCGIYMESSKGLTMASKRLQLSKICALLQTGLFAPNRNRGGTIEEIWIKQCIANGRKQAIVGGSVGFVAMTLLGLLCYIKKLQTDDSTKWDLPCGKLTIIDVSYSPNYEFVLISQTLSLYYCALTYISTDLVISYVLAHIATQCRILQHSIKLFLRKGQALMEEEIGGPNNRESKPWEYLRIPLSRLVDHHNAIIDISRQFEGIFSPIMLIEHVGVLMTSCFVMYDASKYPVTDSRFLQDVFIAMTVIVQVCVIGYYGSEVMFESENIGRACYETNFVGADIRLQNAWAFIIQRSQQQVKFTVGKFTLLSMFKAAVSYFMVLRGAAGRHQA